VLILTKYGLGYILGGFFTLSSGHPESNPTTMSYNASVVKIYSATNSMARFYDI
jgi:K+-transporting ATPase A subunit